MRWSLQLLPLVAGLALVLPAAAQADVQADRPAAPLQLHTLELRAALPGDASRAVRLAGRATAADALVSGEVYVWATLKPLPAEPLAAPPVAEAPAAVLTAGLPAEIALRSVYPNPLAGQARIPYELPAASAVRLAVYDALGREVAVVASGERPAGFHEASLDASGLSPGVYHVRLTAGAFVGAARFTVVR